MYVREQNNGSLGALLDGLDLDEEYLLDSNNWVSHTFLHVLYHRMIAILGDDNAVYKMALASGRFQSLGLLDDLARLLGSPKLIYAQASKYNRLLKLNGDVHIHELGDSWVVLEDRYHKSAQKTRYDCDYTRGVLVGMPTIFDMPPAYVEEIKCQVAPDTYGKRIWPDTPTQGGRGCLYRVRWDKGRKIPLRKRLFGRLTVYRKAIDDLQEANRRIQEKYDEVRRLASDLQTANRQLLESKQQLESKAADLLVSEERYRFLAENVSDIIWTLSLETMRFEYASPSVESIRGLTAEEAMRLSLEETLTSQSLETVTGALAEELAREGQVGVDPGRHRTIEIQQLCKDGSYAWAEATMSFIRNEEGRPVGVLGVTRDMTERKRMEEELRRSRDELELRVQKRTAELARVNEELQVEIGEREKAEEMLRQAQKMEAVGTLVGGIAHDFNNILAVIGINADMARLDLSGESSIRKRLELIAKAEQHGRDVVRQMLLFSRKSEKRPEALSLGLLLKETYKLLRASIPTTIDMKLHLETKSDLVFADPSQIRQVIMNLCSNAEQAMRGTMGNLEISLKNITFGSDDPLPDTEMSPGDYLVLSVKDTGSGMDEEVRRRIFEPFFTTKPAGEGTGLGLSVVYGIVKSHKGGIIVVTEPAKGSVFEVFLPKADKGLPAGVESQETIAKGNERILFVDDDELIVISVRNMLQSLGYTVTALTDSREALKLFSENPSQFDLVITDLTMPLMTGEALGKEMIRIRPDIPVILCTGYNDLMSSEKAIAMGFREFIMKPFTVGEGSQLIRKVFGQQQSK